MNVQVLMFRQDDPKKCTAAKLVKFGLARPVSRTRSNTIVLDPFAKQTLLKHDAKLADSVTGIDCSWNMAENTFTKKFSGIPRRLPPLLAGNPVNYSKLDKLTTVEAIAAAVFILGYESQALGLLSKFNWGHTFYELNKELLKDYSSLQLEDQIEPLLRQYGIVNRYRTSPVGGLLAPFDKKWTDAGN
jgi:pre-rRNA-processing protein TSR3